MSPVASAVLSVGLAAWLAAVWAGLGVQLLPARIVGDRPLGPLVAAACGLGVAQALILLLGLAGWMSGPAAWGLLVLGAAAVWTSRAEMVGWVALGRRWCRERRAWEGGLIALMVCGLLIMLVLSLVPPIGNMHAYQLTLPDGYRRLGRIMEPPYQEFFHFPQAAEMLVYLAVQTLGEPLPGAINWVIGLGLVGAVAAAAALTGLSGAGLWAAAWCATSPLVVGLALESYSDYGVAACAVLAVAAAWRGRTTGDWAWAAVAGGLSGLAFSFKYTGLLVLVVVSAMLLVRRGLRPALIAALAGMVVAAPWWLKNIMLTGNPLAPFLGSLFPTPSRLAEFGASLSQANSLPVGGFREIFARPVVWLWGLGLAGVRGVPGRGGVEPIGLIFFLLLLCAASARRTVSGPWQAAGAGLLYLGWCFTSSLTRYLLPALGLLMALAGAGVAACGRFRAPLRRAIPAAAAATLLVQIAVTMRAHDLREYLGAATGRLSREDFLATKILHASAVRYLNTLPQDATVLFYGEWRPYFCHGRVLAPNRHTPHPFVRLLNDGPDARAVRDGLRAMGVTHILMSPRGWPLMEPYHPGNRLTEAGRARLDSARGRWLKRVFQDGSVSVWEVSGA